MKPLLIEAVTVCEGYADFLRVTAGYNRPMFDNWVIVTSPKDKETQDVCRKYGIRCVITNDFHSFGDTFNKARAINRGLSQLSHRGWVVHIDADVILPPHFRQALNSAQVDDARGNIYGCDRVMVKSAKQWRALKASGYLGGFPQHSYHNWLRVSPRIKPEGPDALPDVPPVLPMGDRWADVLHGWVPIGFFQMWHGEAGQGYGINTKQYPIGHNSAERTDVQFALQWDRNNRVLIPEFVAIHLESEPSPIGINWRGRKSKQFVEE